jgi:hypothetical protein
LFSSMIFEHKKVIQASHSSKTLHSTRKSSVYKQLHYYPVLSLTLLRCFILCGTPAVFISTHCKSYRSTDLYEPESVISTSDIEVSLLNSSTERLPFHHHNCQE